ncbi:MAG: acyl carrier protein [Lacibacter sp.]|jgi:acyl carrier protein
MTVFETSELRNIDPLDVSDVLTKIEKSFGFTFDDTELKDVKTFGELCDIITSKVQGDNSNDCTTQQAFYKLRNAIADTLLIDKNSIAPETDLQKLFPKNIRRQSFKAIDGLLGFKTKVLRPKHSITGTLAIIFIVSLIGLFAFWQIGLVGLTASIISMTIAMKFGNEIDLLTVGQFADKLSREHYLKSRRATTTVNKTEIAQKIKDLFIAELGLQEHQLTRQASFV